MFYVLFLEKNLLTELNYWNVDLQEAYFSPEEVKKRKEILDKK